MNYEMEPKIRNYAERLLPDSELKGQEYLGSKIKRALDCLIATPASPFTMGVSGIAGLVVYAEDKHWPPFVDLGLRKDGVLKKDLSVFKVRSMIPGAIDHESSVMGEYLVQEFKEKGLSDSRITRAGKFIRKTNIDELPQVRNVVRNEMSLVGPRRIGSRDWKREILPNKDVDPYLSFINCLNQNTKIGITGIYVVMRKKFEIDFKTRIALEVMYSERATLASDLKILLKTFPSVFTSTG